MAIAFADKRRVLVERQRARTKPLISRRADGGFGSFTTVLGPDCNSFHANNMHLDIEPHRSSGSYRIPINPRTERRISDCASGGTWSGRGAAV